MKDVGVQVKTKAMITVEFLKDYNHLSNTWKKGDKPTISKSLASELKRKGIVKILDNQDETTIKQAGNDEDEEE